MGLKAPDWEAYRSCGFLTLVLALGARGCLHFHYASQSGDTGLPDEAIYVSGDWSDTEGRILSLDTEEMKCTLIEYDGKEEISTLEGRWYAMPDHLNVILKTPKGDVERVYEYDYAGDVEMLVPRGKPDVHSSLFRVSDEYEPVVDEGPDED